MNVTSWQHAEALAALWMAAHGFPDAVVTRGGADGGVDVSASHAVAQVKFSTTNASRPQIQQLMGVADATGRKALFFSLTGYSKAAMQWANDARVALFIYDYTGDIVPANAAGWEIADRRTPEHAGAARRQAAPRDASIHIAQHLGKVRGRDRREQVRVLTTQLRGEPVRAVAYGKSRNLFGSGRPMMLVLTPLRLLAAESPAHGQVRYYTVPRHELTGLSRGGLSVTWDHFGQRVKLTFNPPERLYQPFIEALGRDRKRRPGV